MSPTRVLGVKRYSPTRKLPCIEYEGRFVNDSTDIAHFLDATFPDPPILPEEARARAQCHLLEDWADESMNFYMMKLRWLPQNRAHWMQAVSNLTAARRGEA